MVEREHLGGGSAPNWGCIPTKGVAALGRESVASGHEQRQEDYAEARTARSSADVKAVVDRIPQHRPAHEWLVSAS